MKHLGLWLGLAIALAPVLAQTTHEGDTGGEFNTVTVYTKSHVHIDKGLVAAAYPDKPQIQENEIVRHGHEGPRILRVMLPGLKKGDYRRGLLGTTIAENDEVEIGLVDLKAAKSSLGLLKLSRTVNDPRGDDWGFLTNGHLSTASPEVSLKDCVQACEAVAPGRSNELCRRQAEGLKASIPANKKSTWLWIYTFDPGRKDDLQWLAKTPTETAMRTIIAEKVKDKIKFEFSLVKKVQGKPEGDPEALGMSVLRVKRGSPGREKFEVEMPVGAKFEVCDYDEEKQVSKCVPVPECQRFWPRHFNKGCKLYGGEGVFTGPRDSKDGGHRH
jgi:hypothetical protein